MPYLNFTVNARLSFVIIKGRRMKSLFIVTQDSQMKSRGNLAGINIGETRGVNKEFRYAALLSSGERSAIRSFLRHTAISREHRGQLISAGASIFLY